MPNGGNVRGEQVATEEPRVYAAEDVTWDVETDILIAGAGACGLVAALEASANEDITVTVLEKGDEVGGNLSLATGNIPAAPTRLQADAGVEDSPELMARDILEVNGHQADEEFVRYLCEQSAEMVHWFIDEWDLPLELITDYKHHKQSAYRWHNTARRKGRYLVAHFEEALAELDNVEVLTNAPVRSLVRDDDSVVGVSAGVQFEEFIGTGKVILATDGFGANKEMVAEFIGEEESELFYYGADGNTGDGIKLGMELGAETAFMDSWQGHSTVTEEGIRARFEHVFHGAIIVNSAGERFADETVGYSGLADDINAQPGRIGYLLTDQSICDKLWEGFEGGSDRMRYYESGDSIRELAETLGINPATTERTVERYNVAVDDDADEVGRRELRSHLKPPFYGVKVKPALFHTQGGLVVDEHGRVTRSSGGRIENLYAGGGCAAGISGHGNEGYYSGNGLLTAFVLGRLAGTHARESIET